MALGGRRRDDGRMSVRAVDVTVTGRVQGVFFRARCEEQAHALGVTGWVGNADDGSVTGHFEGDPDVVEQLIDWCHDGSSRARVTDVDVRETPEQGCTGFRTA